MQEHEPEAFEEIFSAPEKPLIVGGQAVNIWANYYKNDSDELNSLAPFTSKDPDIVTTPAIACALAKSKGWELCIFEDTRQTMVGIFCRSILTRPDCRNWRSSTNIMPGIHNLYPENYYRK